MSLPRFIFDSSAPFADGRVRFSLAGDEYHHLRVRRIERGEHIVLSPRDGDTPSVEVEVLELEEGACDGRVVAELPPLDMPDVTLVCGISKGDRMELTVKASTELGVSRIIPVTTSRCVVQLAGDGAARKADRWRRIALEASKQSCRDNPPIVDDPLDLATALDGMAGKDLILIAWEEQREGSLHTIIDDFRQSWDKDIQPEVAVIVGPEGGLSAAEVDVARSHGAHPFTLGRTILRCETACIVACALTIHELGGLGNER